MISVYFLVHKWQVLIFFWFLTWKCLRRYIFWMHLLVILGHVFSDESRVIRCFWSLIIICPHPGDPARGDQSPRGEVSYCSTAPHSRSTATMRPFPLLPRCFYNAVLSLQGILESAAMTDLQNSDTWPQLVHSRLSSYSSYTPQQAYTFGILVLVDITYLVYPGHSVNNTSGQSEVAAMHSVILSCLPRST